MKKYIIDTSVLARFLVHQGEREIAQEVIKRAYNREIQLLAPSLIFYELNNVFVVRGVSTENTLRGMGIFHELVVENVIQIIKPSENLLRKSREIANLEIGEKAYISSYDATFHALALLKAMITKGGWVFLTI